MFIHRGILQWWVHNTVMNYNRKKSTDINVSCCVLTRAILLNQKRQNKWCSHGYICYIFNKSETQVTDCAYQPNSKSWQNHRITSRRRCVGGGFTFRFLSINKKLQLFRTKMWTWSPQCSGKYKTTEKVQTERESLTLPAETSLPVIQICSRQGYLCPSSSIFNNCITHYWSFDHYPVQSHQNYSYMYHGGKC